MLEALLVVGEGHDDSMGQNNFENFERNHIYVAPTFDDVESSSSCNRFKMKLKEFHNYHPDWEILNDPPEHLNLIASDCCGIRHGVTFTQEELTSVRQMTGGQDKPLW
ncbi:hypothetical protein MLD38_019407 [Melastoma candidum]|uniref:Uncharacterized protein n=1 Tax=Melastoma candidum TaxID=119954 RepID=A0ACB9QYS5_9MYRT|nr:hypothetical protein MLD38_019407 [Melastoma candidum]